MPYPHRDKRFLGKLFSFAFLAVCTAHPASSQTSVYSDLAPLPSNECDTAMGMQDTCNVVSWNDSVSARIVAARSLPGTAAKPIDVPYTSNPQRMACRYVDNSTAQSFFVPFRSPEEWEAFIKTFESPSVENLRLVGCVRPTVFVLAPGETCASPSPTSEIVKLPYARAGGTKRFYTAAFSCGGKALETVTASYIAGVAADVPCRAESWLSAYDPASGWTQSSQIVFTKGSCGAANDLSYDQMPTTDLCIGSTASAVSGNGPWTWTCSVMGSAGPVRIQCHTY